MLIDVSGPTAIALSSPPPKQGGARATQPSSPWQLLKPWVAIFQRVELAIVLLSLLALGVLVGVLIPQDNLVDIYDLKEQYGAWYTPMRAMGLFTVYSSPWFIAIEVLFFFNLLLGSFQWLRPAWRSATQVTFCKTANILATAQPSVLAVSDQVSLTFLATTLTQHLKKRGYGVHIPHESSQTQNTNYQLYAHKANFSRLGPVVAHFGILLLLVATVYGVFTGFTGQQMMSSGETASFATLDKFTPRLPEPWWQGSRPDWQLALHDFNIEYYAKDPTTPKQYVSDLELRSADGKQSLARQNVSVNYPLSLGSVMFYQASFAPTGRLFLQVDGKPLTVEVNTEFNGRPIAMMPLGDANRQLSLVVFPFFVKQDPGVTANHVRVFLHEGDSFANKQTGKMPPNLTLNEGQSGSLFTNDGQSVAVSYIEPEIATGFQIKSAPETPWVYLAFGIISLGTVMCFFSQRQVWVAVETNDAGQPTVYLAYKTKKAPYQFQQERLALEADLLAALSKQAKQELAWQQATPPLVDRFAKESV